MYRYSNGVVNQYCTQYSLHLTLKLKVLLKLSCRPPWISGLHEVAQITLWVVTQLFTTIVCWQLHGQTWDSALAQVTGRGRSDRSQQRVRVLRARLICYGNSN